MRKITALFLSLILVFSTMAAVSADDISETLSAVGILPSFSGGENDPVTREELSYMTAKLVGALTEPKVTRFADVTEDNIYSGDIEYLASLGVVDGTGGGNFNPKGYANFGMAAKMVVNVLGFGSFAESYGGYPEGYMNVLSKLGLDKGVSLAADSLLSAANAKILMHNALTMELNALSYAETDGQMETVMSSDKNDSLLAEAFGVSVYEGNVTKVTDDGSYITVEITRNKYDSNPVDLPAGSSVSFAVGEGIAAESFANVPVAIWVDENDTVIKISPQKNVEVRYVNIASVNGDTRENELYAIGKMDEVTFLDDETQYSVSESATMVYNGSYTVSQKAIVGKFAKVVLKDEEIIFIESWDLVRGGLITDFNGTNITYLKDGNQAVLRDIADCDKIVTIIGKRAASLGEITADTLFSYYKSGNYAVIIASERKVIDELVSVSSDSVEIGEMIYKTKDVLYTEDAKKFTKDYAPFFGRNVAAYIGPDGYVWVIKAVSGESSVSEFYGIVSGIQMDTMDPEFGQIELFKVEEQTVTKEIYDITDKTVFESGLSLAMLSQNAKNTKGEGIYIFKVNASGRITSVSLTQPLYGFATGVASVSSFDQNNAFMTVDGKGLFFTGQPVLGIYKDNNDEFAAEFMSWSSLAGKSIGAGTVRFLGKDKDSVPALIVLSGDLASLGSYIKYGVISDIMETISESGEPMKQVTVLSMSGTKAYKMLPEDADELKENMWIAFKDNVAFNESELIISENIDLNGDYMNWPYKKSSDTEAGLHMGIADTADKNRILLKEVDTTGVVDENGRPTVLENSAYYFHPSQNFFVAYYPDAPETKFKAATYADIDSDDTVLWNYRGDGVRGVIVIK